MLFLKYFITGTTWNTGVFEKKPLVADKKTAKKTVFKFPKIQASFSEHVAWNSITPAKHHKCTLCKSLGSTSCFQNEGLNKERSCTGSKQNGENLIKNNLILRPVCLGGEGMMLNLKCVYESCSEKKPLQNNK